MNKRLDFLKIAFAEIGTKGITGEEHNKRIIQYFNEIGHAWVKNDETAWCAAFLSWVFQKTTGEKLSNISARSFLAVGKSTVKPELGDIAVFWRESPESWKGHVGIYLSQADEYVYVLGGNQANEVTVAKVAKKQLLGYRKLFD